MTAGATEWRYSAFISYSHQDVDFAKSLQKWLEEYRLPRALRNSSPAVDPRTGRLKPVFRDLDELTAAPDLSAVVREAIGASRFLIIICTPRAPMSDWVNQEIALARELLGEGSILTALFEGDPDSAFPPALISETLD